jgi:hypothetical protein
MPTAVADTSGPRTDDRLVFDNDRLSCRREIVWLRLNEAIGRVRPIDARLRGSEVSFVLRQGFDPDERMALHHGGEPYLGADSIQHALRTMHRRSLWDRVGQFVRLVFPGMRPS